MSRGILTTVSVFVVAILVVVAGFFLLDIEKNALNYWSFGSLLFSLVVSLFITLTLVRPKRNKTGALYNAGLSGAVWIYEVLVIISIFFTRAFIDHLNRFILLQIVLNALLFIAAAIIISAAGRSSDSNMQTADKLQSGEHNMPKRGGF